MPGVGCTTALDGVGVGEEGTDGKVVAEHPANRTMTTMIKRHLIV
jgi:hypothetical protein